MPLDGVGIGNAHKPFAAFAERVARNDGDALRLQQTHTEVAAGKTRRADARKDIERALGREAVKPHAIQSIHKQTAAHIILAAHLLNVDVYKRQVSRRSNRSSQPARTLC